jgi:hypothetical protein
LQPGPQSPEQYTGTAGRLQASGDAVGGLPDLGDEVGLTSAGQSKYNPDR